MKNIRFTSCRLTIGATALPLLLLLLNACQQEKKLLPTLFGYWQGKNWYIEDKPADVDAAQVAFEFNPDSTYAAQFGEQMESGTWYTQDDKLYTTATGRSQIVTRIIEANEQELKIEMNRAGRKERLELIKK